jgi:hypothetical protein
MTYYDRARDIARELTRAGLADDALALEEAIDTGSTGTEIMMGLRWHLRRIDASHTLEPETRQRVGDLIAELDRALAP